jgi:hypothetical protein
MKNTFILLSLLSTVVSAQSCQELYQQHLKTDMDLSYKEFDQTMGKGFRELLKEGLSCEKEAAMLIENYIEVNNATENSLRWHVAQGWANYGDYQKSIKWSKTVLLEDEDFSKRELRWNDFVLANIAFFEQDKEQLIKHRDVIAAAKEKHFGNQLNLKYLNSLITHFDKSFKYAMQNIAE